MTWRSVRGRTVTVRRVGGQAWLTMEVDGQYELFAYRPFEKGFSQVDEIARSWVFS